VIYRTLDDIKGSDRETDTPNWISRRLLVKSDGMGFSLHETIVRAGTTTEMQYTNHVEAVYCVEGAGSLTTVNDGREFPISPGTMYALNAHDRHVLRADTDLRVVCVFNPPCTGREVHDENGSYPLME
jgi:L-ectoine synthase